MYANDEEKEAYSPEWQMTFRIGETEILKLQAGG
jgi:alpha-tubulin suppressor-like RCC1 family protein